MGSTKFQFPPPLQHANSFRPCVIIDRCHSKEEAKRLNSLLAGQKKTHVHRPPAVFQVSFHATSALSIIHATLHCITYGRRLSQLRSVALPSSSDPILPLDAHYCHNFFPVRLSTRPRLFRGQADDESQKSRSNFASEVIQNVF